MTHLLWTRGGSVCGQDGPTSADINDVDCVDCILIHDTATEGSA